MSATANIASFRCLTSQLTTLKSHSRTHLQSPDFFKPNPTFKFPRICQTTRKETKHVFPVVASCSVTDDSEAYRQREQPSVSNESIPANLLGATIDLKLPRRSLLVHFTCNACGERSKKLINRLAYEKGTVFIQCSGCSQYHKLVDNLTLVIEYDLREEINMSSDTHQA